MISIEVMKADYIEDKVPFDIAYQYLQQYPILPENPLRIEVLNYHKAKMIVEKEYVDRGIKEEHISGTKKKLGRLDEGITILQKASEKQDMNFIDFINSSESLNVKGVLKSSSFHDRETARAFIEKTILYGQVVDDNNQRLEGETRKSYLFSTFHENEHLKPTGLELLYIANENDAYIGLDYDIPRGPKPRSMEECKANAVRVSFRKKVSSQISGFHGYPCQVRKETLMTSFKATNKRPLESPGNDHPRSGKLSGSDPKKFRAESSLNNHSPTEHKQAAQLKSQENKEVQSAVKSNTIKQIQNTQKTSKNQTSIVTKKPNLIRQLQAAQRINKSPLPIIPPGGIIKKTQQSQHTSKVTPAPFSAVKTSLKPVQAAGIKNATINRVKTNVIKQSQNTPTTVKTKALNNQIGKTAKASISFVKPKTPIKDKPSSPLPKPSSGRATTSFRTILPKATQPLRTMQKAPIPKASPQRITNTPRPVQTFKPTFAPRPSVTQRPPPRGK